MSWRERAVCATLPPREADRIFFGEGRVGFLEAERICLACPVRSACLAEVDKLEAEGTTAGSLRHMSGIWAGLGPSQRARRRRPELGAVS